MQSAAATHAPAQYAALEFISKEKRLCFQSFWEYGAKNGAKILSFHKSQLPHYAAVLFALSTACLFYLYGPTRNYFTACMLI